jgi:ribonuclease HIII
MTFVKQIDISLAGKLQAGLIEQGFELSQPPHTLFQGKKKGVNCTLYTSGKLVVQGKGMAEFIEFFLEPEILQDFSFSHKAEYVDPTSRIGVDESGKGDVFGPLVVAAVQASGDTIAELAKMGVQDSKKIRDREIYKLAKEIRIRCKHAIVVMNPLKYNELYAGFKNLNKLLAWGHATAIEKVVAESGCKTVIVDKFAAEHVVEQALARKKVEVDLTQRTKGEEDIVVAAASILARAGFVYKIADLGKEWELEIPKGAGSKVDAAIKNFISKHGKENLPAVAKMHFKNVSALVNG